MDQQDEIPPGTGPDGGHDRDEEEGSRGASHHSLASRSIASHGSSQHSLHSRSDTAPGDGCFFADMTLDLTLAQMESTPRTDLKFAALANRESRDAAIDAVPPMPLIEERGGAAAAGGAGTVGRDAEVELSNVDAAGNGNGSHSAAARERPLARIDSASAPAYGGESSHSVTNSSAHSYPRPARPPRRPRDVSWTAAALIAIPFGLVLPHLYYPNRWIDRHDHRACGDDDVHDEVHPCHPRHASWSSMALSPAAHTAVLLSCLSAAAASLALLRILYSHPGGGEGDDPRHVGVTRTLLLAGGLRAFLNPLLASAVWLFLPGVRWAALLPLAWAAGDGIRAATGGAAGSGGGGRGGAADSSTLAERRSFFRALAVAALDVLSRSLRRNSFVRAASALVLLELVCVLLWWGAVGVVLSVEVFDEDGAVTKFMRFFWLIMSLAAGKWATGIVARLLGFVAAGGVAGWFARQDAMIEEARARREWQQRQERQRQPRLSSVNESGSDDDGNKDDATGGDDPGAGHAAARAALSAMPEAYRTADASAYAPAMDFDEGLDDDYDDDEADNDLVEPSPWRGGSWHGSGSDSYHPTPSVAAPTVKSLIATGCTVCLGSVAQCGLLGGPAQLLWGAARNADAAGSLLRRRFRPNGPGGFRGMDIVVDGGRADPRPWKRAVAHWWRKLDVAVRGFVRSHSDLAMSHVAAYFKGYQRAANDVAVLIETSGVESIVHDDITTRTCSSLCHLVAGSASLVFGTLLVAHRNAISSEPLGDASVLEALIFAYVFSYTIVFTALEPLRAAIKAMYVCFAEHPASLGQAFPLIYQRLSRISEARR
ncbi:hypothetical protein ACHAWF_016980 [Thalassiosira exigua]